MKKLHLVDAKRHENYSQQMLKLPKEQFTLARVLVCLLVFHLTRLSKQLSEMIAQQDTIIVLLRLKDARFFF